MSDFVFNQSEIYSEIIKWRGKANLFLCICVRIHLLRLKEAIEINYVGNVFTY